MWLDSVHVYARATPSMASLLRQTRGTGAWCSLKRGADMSLSGEAWCSLERGHEPSSVHNVTILLSSTHMHTTHTPCTHKCSHTVQLKGGRVTCKKILFFIYMWISCWACFFFLAVVLWVKTLSKTANYHSHYSFSVAVDLG